LARIAGIDLPNNKRLEIGLTYIFGLGLFSVRKILKIVRIDPAKKAVDLSEDEIAKLRKVLEADFKIEGALRAEVQQNIRRLIEIKSYRGLRHRRGLPTRGQRTKCNARTRKGPKRRVGGKRK